MRYFKNNSFLLLILFVHLSIFLINNSWDGSIIDYGFSVGNLSGIKTWYWESSSNFQFIIIKILFFIKNLTNLPNELIFDLFTITFLILFCVEIQKYAEQVFNLNKRNSQICFIIALAYPVWNSLTEINLGLYLFCFYLAILGYRFFNNKSFLIKFLGLLSIICSFSIKSNFAFVLALPLIDCFYNFLQKKKINYRPFVLIFLVCLLSYLINIFYYPPYGNYAGYNQIQLNNIDLISLIENIKNYFSFLLYFALGPVVFSIYFKFKFKKKINLFNSKTIKVSLVLFIFFLIVLSPYILVEKSTDIFNFVNFDSRHAYLTAIPISIFLSIFISKISEKINLKASIFLKNFIILQSLLILSLSYFVKYNSTLIDKNLVNSFQSFEEPKSGYVIIYSDELTRNFYHLNNLLYKSYNKAAWFAEINKKSEFKKVSNKDFYLNNYKKIISIQAYPFKHVMNDQINNCLTLFKLENEINTFEFIKKLHLLNHKKYFTLKKISEDC